MIAAGIGVALGSAAIGIARRSRWERHLYALSLITLPLIYVGFALLADAETAAWLELVVGIPFIVAGVLLARHAPRAVFAMLGLLWLSHGLYDLAHGHLFVNPGTPTWYPAFCAGVDVAIGVYLLLRWRSANLSIPATSLDEDSSLQDHLQIAISEERRHASPRVDTP